MELFFLIKTKGIALFEEKRNLRNHFPLLNTMEDPFQGQCLTFLTQATAGHQQKQIIFLTVMVSITGYSKQTTQTTKFMTLCSSLAS